MFFRASLLIIGCALLPLCAACSTEREPVAPSIVVITADDLGNQLGSYGDHTIPTPNIDAIAARGTRFTRAYVTQPSCSPSRASILTGLYPHQNGQIGLAHMGFTLSRDWPVTPGLLREELGYYTALAGKLHVRFPSAITFFDALALESGTIWTQEIDDVGRKAASFFRQAQGRPFYIQFDLFDPHPPFEARRGGLPVEPIDAARVNTFSWTAPPNAALATETANYYNAVSRLDSIVGRIIEELRLAGRLENTVIVFWSDNGPAFPRAKTLLYEAGTRVPLIIAGPGIMAGQVRDELVSMVDILPTLVQMTGAKIPAGTELYTGWDLAPLLQGETLPWRQYLFTEENFHTPEQWTPARAVTDGRWKLIHHLPVRGAGEKIELYDLEEDPDERMNLAGQPAHSDVRDRLLGELMQWRVKTGDPLLDAAVFNRLDQVPLHPQEAVEPWYSPR